MKKLVFGALSLIAILGLAGCANPNAITKEEVKSIKFLSGNEIKTVFSGNTIVGNYYKYDSQFILTFKSDGTYNGTVNDGKRTTSGTWSIKGNENCLVRSQGTSCIKYFKKDNKYFSVDKNMNKRSDFIIK